MAGITAAVSAKAPHALQFVYFIALEDDPQTLILFNLACSKPCTMPQCPTLSSLSTKIESVAERGTATLARNRMVARM